MNIEKVVNLIEPKAPILPANPIEEAEQCYQRELFPIPDWLERLPSLERNFPTSVFDIITPSFFDNKTVPLTYSYFIGDNEILLKRGQIPHRDMSDFSGIYFVPLEKGKGQIVVSLMCSEYIEPEEQVIDIEVI